MLPVSLVGTAFKRLFFQSLISLRRSKNSTHLHIPESRGRRTGPRGSHLTQGTLQFALNARKIVSAENNELPELNLLSHHWNPRDPKKHSSLQRECCFIFGHVKCLPFVYISLNMPSGKLVSKIHTKYKQISIKHTQPVKFLLSRKIQKRDKYTVV